MGFQWQYYSRNPRLPDGMLRERRHHINIPASHIVESIATLPSVVKIKISTLIERSVTEAARSHIDRKHDRQWLKSFFLLEIERLAYGQMDRDGVMVNLRVHKYGSSPLSMLDRYLVRVK